MRKFKYILLVYKKLSFWNQKNILSNNVVLHQMNEIFRLLASFVLLPPDKVYRLVY